MKFSEEKKLREEMIEVARSLFNRGYSHGTTGNLSVRFEDKVLVTPTGSSLGFVKAEEISLLDFATGKLLNGEKPSKESHIHLAAYSVRPEVKAIVHLHSTFAVAYSCLRGLNATDSLEPLTPYFVMKIGKLPLIQYLRPGDSRLVDEIEQLAPNHNGILMANHGTLVLGKDLYETAANAEELEEQAKIYFLVNGKANPLNDEQIAELHEVFKNAS